jgi:hypothetical protein
VFALVVPLSSLASGPAKPFGKVIFQETIKNGSDLTDGRYRDLKYHEAEWYGSTFFAGPDWTRVGKDWHHPGQDTPSVRCFVLPRDGRVTVSGRVFKLHRSGDGILATICHNEREVWKAEIDGDDGEGTTHNLTLHVHRGDRVRFVVDKRGGISCDTTGWDPSLRFEDGTTFSASKAFERHEQGAEGWGYEMEVRSAQKGGLPIVYAWSPQLALQHRPVRPGKPVELTERDGLPLFVIANGRDQGGRALAAPLDGAWRFVAKLDDSGDVHLSWHTGGDKSATVVVNSRDYHGSWAKGWMVLDDCMSKQQQLAPLKARLAALALKPDIPLGLRAMVQADWRRQDSLDETAKSYLTAANTHLQRAWAMVRALRAANGPSVLKEEYHQLEELTNVVCGTTAPGSKEPSLPHDRLSRGGLPGLVSQQAASCQALWLDVRRLKRRIALANPLLDFGPMLVCKRVPPSWSHLVAQYFGWRQRPGGGLYVIERPGRSLAMRDILRGQLPAGSVLEPRLSYDGRRILFAFVACSDEVPNPASLPVNEGGPTGRYFHLYEIHFDGTGLRQLTDGPYDDMMAEYLPDGDIVFCSTRRKGYSRCFGPEYSYRWHTYTLHRMSAANGNIRTLSYNDVSEWFPAVANSGNVLHARWDYIDRDAVTHQNLWSIRPDGTNPTAVWGNATPKPHCVFQAKPIPQSNKIVFIGSAHHAITGGPVCILDPTIDANSLNAVTRVTPLPFPEAEGKLNEWYAAPWPLSEDYFLVAYSPYALRFQGEHQTNPNPDNALGIYLLDAAGNRELLYRDPDISTTNPMPLVPRARPPVLPAAEPVAGKRTGEMVVTDVYQGLGEVPRGTIKKLRVVQVFPKTTWLANRPRMGVAGEENGRAILGTVPVEADGSAYFEVPAGKPVLFQALDEQGMAYQTMRSLTFVQPGERTSCIGCHEHRMLSPPFRTGRPLALRRPPSTIESGDLGGRPFGYVEVVQPVLDRHCVSCHGRDKMEANLDLTATAHQGFTRSYLALCGSPNSWKSLHFDPAIAETHLVPRFVQRNQIQVTPPGGTYGARGSRLMRLLRGDHYGVHLPAADIRRLAAWIDLNAIFYGVYDAEGQARQLTGKPVAMPDLQ